MRRRVALGALVVAAAIGFVTPTAVRAAAGGPMSADGSTFTGTDGDDLLVLAHDGGVLTHNRFAAGDPGFESAADFDSATAGVQTKGVGTLTVNFNGLGGDDTVQVVGTMPYPLATMEFGAGNDTLDLANFGQGTYVGSPRIGNIEKVIGTAFDDELDPIFGDATTGVTLLGGDGHDILHGTDGDDVLDGGAGDTEVDARGGNDTVTVAAPFPSTMRTIEPGIGDDTLVVRGRPTADDLAVVPDLNWTTTVLDGDNDSGGYRFFGEHVTVELGDGDDDLFVEPRPGGVVVDGGLGSDSLTIDALKGTAVVSPEGADKVYGLPGGRQLEPTSVRVKPGMESRSIINETLLVTAPGAGGGPHVRAYRVDRTEVAGFMAYAPSFTGGVNISLGDVDGDGNDEIVTAPGPGGGPHVRVFRANGSDTGVGFMAYDPSFTGGVNVAAIDVDGDGVDEIVTVPASGHSPQVRIWAGDGELLDEWIADDFGNTGLRVARGARGGEPGEEIVLTAVSGPSVGRVLDWNGDEINGGSGAEFTPYPGFSGGAYVSGARFVVPTYGLSPIRRDLVTGAGPGAGPHVRLLWSNPNHGYQFEDIAGFYAYAPEFHGGVDVTTCNPDGVADEVVTAAGAGGGPHVRMFRQDGAPMALSFMAYDPNFRGGVRVACGGAESKVYF
jgi:hypothetical protein